MFSPFAVNVKHDKLLSSRRSRYSPEEQRKAIINKAGSSLALHYDLQCHQILLLLVASKDAFKRPKETKNGLSPESENLWQRELCTIKKKGIKKKTNCPS